MRELTNKELSKCLSGAIDNLPNDCKDAKIIMIVSTITPKGLLINRVSNCVKELANDILKKWVASSELFDKFGGQNSN